MLKAFFKASKGVLTGLFEVGLYRLRAPGPTGKHRRHSDQIAFALQEASYKNRERNPPP